MTEWCDIHTKADKSLAQEAEAVFNRLGLTMQEAITLFLERVNEYNDLPFNQEDDVFPHPEDPGFQAWENDFNRKIEEAEASIAAGQFVTPEQLKANMEKLIASYAKA